METAHGSNARTVASGEDRGSAQHFLMPSRLSAQTIGTQRVDLATLPRNHSIRLKSTSRPAIQQNQHPSSAREASFAPEKGVQGEHLRSPPRPPGDPSRPTEVADALAAALFAEELPASVHTDALAAALLAEVLLTSVHTDARAPAILRVDQAVSPAQRWCTFGDAIRKVPCSDSVVGYGGRCPRPRTSCRTSSDGRARSTI